MGGAAIRVFSQYENLPVYITGCTFGGAEGYGNSGSNGGAISNIGGSWYPVHPAISMHADTDIEVTDSTIE